MDSTRRDNHYEAGHALWLAFLIITQIAVVTCMRCTQGTAWTGKYLHYNAQRKSTIGNQLVVKLLSVMFGH